MSRRESRVQAFQTLLQLEMKDSDLTINEAISFIKNDNPGLDSEFIHWPVSSVRDREPVLGETTSPYLKDQAIARSLKTDRIILRMTTYKILHSDTPAKIIMNEAVELTKQFSDDDHYKFIDDVLNNIKK